MLSTLDIRNLATVASLDVEFGDGLNAVTGETGAGKSVILGAIQTLLGERAEKTLIRHGAESCEISACFDFSRRDDGLLASLEELLATCGVPPCEDGQLLLRRTVTPAASRCYVNSAPVALRVMRDLGDLLVDIHGPHDHQSLLSPRCQMALLDTFAGNATLLETCADAWQQAKRCREALATLAGNSLAPAECDLLRHQIREIDQAGLDPDEEQALYERHRLAAHARRLVELAGSTAEALSEGENSVADALAGPARQLLELATITPEAGDAFVARLEEIVENTRELGRDLAGFAGNLDLDPQEFARLEERVAEIHDIKRKYRGSIEEILAKAGEMRARLAAVDNREDAIRHAESELAAAVRNHLRAAGELSAAREAAAGRLAAGIAAKLAVLGFASSRFQVDVTRSEAGAAGMDRVEFLFAPNPGQEMMPLRKIASSGEMARVMLAVKTVLVAADPVPLLIFDEVDANVGGRIAGQVAAELASVGKRHQVLCITHLPQIAAVGKTHFLVGKQVEDQSTTTSMTRLSHPERIDELVRMMGSADSANARAHAEEMLAASCPTQSR